MFLCVTWQAGKRNSIHLANSMYGLLGIFHAVMLIDGLHQELSKWSSALLWPSQYAWFIGEIITCIVRILLSFGHTEIKGLKYYALCVQESSKWMIQESLEDSWETRCTFQRCWLSYLVILVLPIKRDIELRYLSSMALKMLQLFFHF